MANREFALIAHRLLPALLARLEFAERCLADLHDETAAAGAVVRMRKALVEIRTATGEANGESLSAALEHIDTLALEALEDAP